MGRRHFQDKQKLYFTDFDPSEVNITCGHGYSTSLEHKCLYRRDVYDHVIGCQSLEHLQDCGKQI